MNPGVCVVFSFFEGHCFHENVVSKCARPVHRGMEEPRRVRGLLIGLPAALIARAFNFGGGIYYSGQSGARW